VTKKLAGVLHVLILFQQCLLPTHSSSYHMINKNCFLLVTLLHQLNTNVQACFEQNTAATQFSCYILTHEM